MAIVVRLDVMLAKRQVRSNALARAIDITDSNLSLLKSGKVRGFRFSTLDAICKHLDCQPGDILEYQPDKKTEKSIREPASRGTAQRRLVDDVLALFGGRSQPVMTHLIETGKLTLEDVQKAETLIRARGKKGRPS
jgi:putative transcriptional regulator